MLALPGVKMSETEARNRARAVREMFSAIAPRYDFLNRLLSLGIDQQWRRFVARSLVSLEKPLVLDVACGTGDLSLAIAGRHPGATVVGLDFSEEMLRLAREKVYRRGRDDRVALVAGSAEELPFAADFFAGLTIAFGIRNVVDRPRALAEFRRVLRPGGRLVILEFSLPENRLFRLVYQGYFFKVLPFIGGLFARRSAYRYLPESVARFPGRDEFCRLLAAAGFRQRRYHTLTGGIVTIYLAEK